PTMPSVSPASSVHDTPSTERTVPPTVSKCVCRSSTSSSGAERVSILAAASELPRQPRVERVAQTVAEQVDREHGQREQDAGVQDDVEGDRGEVDALGPHVAPARSL